MNNPWKRYSKINPQRENGHRQISSEVLQALIRQKLTGAELSIAFAIIDKTWGYGKKFDAIAEKQIEKAVNYCGRTVRYGLKALEDRRIIVREPSSIRGQCGSPLTNYLMNKHYDTWREQGGKGVPRGQRSSKQGGTTLPTQKKEKIKERKRKKSKNKRGQDSSPLLCVCEFVQMKDEELKTLIWKYGEINTLKMLDKLDNYKGASGKKYKSDYRAILTWVADDILGKESQDDVERRRFREIVRGTAKPV